MRDAYYEESAVTQRTESERKVYMLFYVAAIAVFIVAAFILTFALSYLYRLLGMKEQGEMDAVGLIINLVTYFGTILLLVAAGFAFWKLKNRFNVSYDYTFVEDELRVSKVMNGKKRRYLKSFKADRILKLGKYQSEGYKSAQAGLEKKENILLTPNKTASTGKELYYFLYTDSLEKRIYVIEARQELMEHLIRAAGRNKWEAR